MRLSARNYPTISKPSDSTSLLIEKHSILSIPREMSTMFTKNNLKRRSEDMTSTVSPKRPRKQFDHVFRTVPSPKSSTFKRLLHGCVGNLPPSTVVNPLDLPKNKFILTFLLKQSRNPFLTQKEKPFHQELKAWNSSKEVRETVTSEAVRKSYQGFRKLSDESVRSKLRELGEDAVWKDCEAWKRGREVVQRVARERKQRAAYRARLKWREDVARKAKEKKRCSCEKECSSTSSGFADSQDSGSFSVSSGFKSSNVDSSFSSSQSSYFCEACPSTTGIPDVGSFSSVGSASDKIEAWRVDVTAVIT